MKGLVIALTSQSLCPQEFTVLLQDGSVGTAHHNGENILLTMYQTRITPETHPEDVWEELGAGKAYVDSIEGQDYATDSIVKSICNWLVPEFANQLELSYIFFDSEGCDITFYMISNLQSWKN